MNTETRETEHAGNSISYHLCIQNGQWMISEKDRVYAVFWYSTVALNLLMFFLASHLIFANTLEHNTD